MSIFSIFNNNFVRGTPIKADDNARKNEYRKKTFAVEHHVGRSIKIILWRAIVA